MKAARLAILTAFLAAAAVIAAAEPAAVDPANLIPRGGQRIFLSGMNMAWMDYGKDLVTFNEEKFTRHVENIASAGGNCIRWWVFVNGTNSPVFGEDGLVKEMPEAQILALKRALDISMERGVGLLVCLWSFGMLDDAPKTVVDRNKRLLEDPTATKAFIDNALIPMVRRLKGHPGLIAWEIFNEPEGMMQSFGWSRWRTSMEAVQAFINRTAGAIHREAPGNLVTNGSWNIQVLTERGGLVNYYTDERLKKQGGDPDGYLDFYTVHYYPEYFDEALSPFHNPKSHWGLDKPLVIAEFPSKGIVPIPAKGGFMPKTRLTTAEAYRYAMENGYAGALSWTMTAHDGFGGFYGSAEAMSALRIDYGNFIALDLKGIDKGPAVLKQIKDPILNVSQRDWPGLLDLTEYVRDPEDGTNVKFTLRQAGDPSIADVILESTGKLSVRLGGQGKLGTVSVQIVVSDKAGNETPLGFLIHVLDPDRGNVALFKPVKASSIDNADDQPQYVNDGNFKTRWSSAFRDNEWCVIDLQGTFRVTKARLSWETAYGKGYEILGGMDGENWTVLADVKDGRGGVEEVPLKPSNARYVKILGKVRGTQWGFSLWEMDIQGERVKE